MTTHQATTAPEQHNGDIHDLIRDLTDALTQALTARELHVRRLAPHVLVATQPLDPDIPGDDPEAAAIAATYRMGLSQTVALLPVSAGEPLELAWYWWWKGDRGARPNPPAQPGTPGKPGRGDEKEHLADAHAIDYAAARIAQVIRLVTQGA